MEELREKLMGVVADIARYLEETPEFDREDTLWPAYFNVFATNPLSLAYGACGGAAFLRKARARVPEEIREWIGMRAMSPERYPPGLLVGAAGIAYEAHHLDLQEVVEKALAICYQSPLRFSDPTMFFGAAGWGLVSLFFFEVTGRGEFQERASEACDYIIDSATVVDDGVCWEYSGDGGVHCGYGYGASGIALFLLHAGLALDRRDALEMTRRGMAFDLANKTETNLGWSWPNYLGGNVRLPYWMHGASGVGTVAIRMAMQFGDVEYRRAAEIIADSTALKWTILPGQLEGMAGIGEFMIDMYLATGELIYLERGADLAESILWYALERPQGIVFPGRNLNRVSADYATGSAGVGLFLSRLLAPGPRYLVDLSPGQIEGRRGMRLTPDELVAGTTGTVA